MRLDVVASPSAAGVPRSEPSPSMVLSSADALVSGFPKGLVDGMLPDPNILGADLEVAGMEKKLGVGDDFSGTLKGFELLLSDFSAGFPNVKPVVFVDDIPNGLEGAAEGSLGLLALDPNDPNVEDGAVLEFEDVPKPKNGLAAAGEGAVLLLVDPPKVKPELFDSVGRLNGPGVVELNTDGEGLNPPDPGPFDEVAVGVEGLAGGSLNPPNPENVGGGAGIAAAGFSLVDGDAAGVAAVGLPAAGDSSNSACIFVRKDLYFSSASVRSTYGSS